MIIISIDHPEKGKKMKIDCPVSLGELVDKITILEIKIERVEDQEKVRHAAAEKNALEAKLGSLNLDGIDELRQELKAVNEELWVIEDRIRDCEREKRFDQDFIELARSVYITNDKRFEKKNSINVKFGSEFREVKSYEEYE